jgi:hypothetical protein
MVMKLYASLIVLIAFAVLLPGGSLLLPLAYASYRKATGRIRVPASASGR